MFKRRFKLVGKILLAILAVLLGFLLIERWRGQIALANYKKELRAKGEKLSPEDFAVSISEEDNGAPAAIAAIERLQRGIVLPHCYPPRMSMTPAGRAVVCFREDEWIETGTFRDGEWVSQKVTNRWDQLSADLQTNSIVLGEILAALEKPRLNNHVDLASGTRMKFEHLIAAKALTHWCGSGSQLALREGRNRDALPYLLTQIGLPRLLAEDHLAISELVRVAIAAIARGDTWEALQTDGWTDEDLAQLQQAWLNQSFALSMATSLEGERIYISSSIQQFRKSNNETYELLFGPYANFLTGEEEHESRMAKLLNALPYGEQFLAAIRKQLYCRIWRFAWSHQAELRSMRNMDRLIGLMCTASSNASNQSVEGDLTALVLTASEKGFYNRLRFPPPESVVTLSRTINKAMRAETDRALCVSAIALKRYWIRYKKYPENLNALVPEFLSAVPTDYMDGKPIKYRLNTDGSFTLYSVGDNGKDEGGAMSLINGSESRVTWNRLDCVWPAPATPDEVEEFRREALAR